MVDVNASSCKSRTVRRTAVRRSGPASDIAAAFKTVHAQNWDRGGAAWFSALARGVRLARARASHRKGTHQTGRLPGGPAACSISGQPHDLSQIGAKHSGIVDAGRDGRAPRLE